MGEFAECSIGIKEASEFLNSSTMVYLTIENKKYFSYPVIGGVDLPNPQNKINHTLKKEEILLSKRKT